MTGKKMLSIVIVAEFLLVVFALMSTAASPKSSDRIIGGVYNLGEEWGNTAPGGEASYGNATFYTSNADQDGTDKYDVQYYGYHIGDPYSPGYAHHYGYHPGPDAYWYAPQHLSNNVPDVTEYMVIVETISGITKNAAGEIWSGANFTGSTNMTATGDPTDYMPDIYLEQIPTPQNKSTDPATGKIVINWTGLDEWISENSVASSQKWKNQTSNIVGYSVYRSDGGSFERVGNATQNRSGEVYFEDIVEPGDYYYRIAVNYRYGVNTGTSVIDQNGVNPENTKFLGMFVSTGKSNISNIITMLDGKKPTITNMTATPESQIVGGYVNITCTVTDNVKVDKVYVNITGPVGFTPVNITMTRIAGTNSYYYNSTYNFAGDYTYYTWTSDTSGNGNKSAIYPISIQDTTEPTITNIYPENDVTIITNTTTISANYSDTSGIDTSSVILLINNVNYTLKAVEGITETGISYHYTNILDGSYTVYLEVKDNSSNHNKAEKTWSFTVDITPPEVVEALPTGDEVLVYDEVYITFSEPMNTTISGENIFSITPDPGPGSWIWNWNATGELLRGTHNAFTVNRTYNCTINTNAKDKAGNHLDEDYSWNFTTIANLSVTLNWPYVGTEDWTGGSEHTISYSVGGGLSPYTIYLNYTTNGTTFIPIHNETKNVAGVYLYSWTLPNITNATVQVRVEATDSLGAKLLDTSKYFIIDSIKPTVNQSLPLNGSYTPLGSDIVIVFDESMNTATVGASGGSLLGCICTPDPGGWVATWSDDDKKLTLSHNDFTTDQLYTITVTTDTKDESDPGNHLNKSYSWNFTAVPGKGVFTVSIVCPTSAEVGEEYQVTVTVNNAGLPTAYNNSGTLTVKFYKIYPGETPVQIGTAETINAMQSGASETKSSALFTFDKPGTWYIKVELSSTNSIDVIQGYTQSYDTSIPVEVVKPEEAPAGILYLTIAAGVIVLLVLIGIAVALIKKKKIG